MRLEIWADLLTKEIDRRRDSEHLAAPSVDHDGDPFLDAYNIIDCLPDAKSDFFENLAFSSMVEDLASHLDEQDKKSWIAPSRQSTTVWKRKSFLLSASWRPRKDFSPKDRNGMLFLMSYFCQVTNFDRAANVGVRGFLKSDRCLT